MPQSLEQLHGLRVRRAALVQLAQGAHRPGVLHHRQGPVAGGFRVLERRGQRVKIIDLPLGEFRDHVEPAEALQLAHEIIGQVAQQVFCLAARLFGNRASLLRLEFGAARALGAVVGEHGGRERGNGQHRAAHGDAPRTAQGAARRQFAGPLLAQQFFGGFARLAFAPQVAAGLDDAAQHIVGEFHAAYVQALLDAQQTAIHEYGQGARRRAHGVEAADQTFLRDVLAKSGAGQKIIFDDLAHGRRLIGERALVETREDAGVRAGQQVQGYLIAALRDARIVELPANQAEQRRFDLGVRELGAARHEAHDGRRHLVGHQPLAGLHHGRQRLFPGHRRQAQAILRDAGHGFLQALERRQIILAQRDEHAVVAAREIELLGSGFIQVELGLDGLGRPVLDQIGEFLDEAGRAGTAEFIGLGQGEDLLELIEDQQRGEGGAGLIAQHVVAMVQEFPQRLALDGDAGSASIRPSGRAVRLMACLICSAGSGDSRP